MPIHTGQDKNGKFYQWGKTGKKYYFKPGDEASRKRARGKAEAQQTAIYSSGWKGDKQTMKLIKVRKGDSDVLSENKFGKVQVMIKELGNGRIMTDFMVPVAGASGSLETVKDGLKEMKQRIKEVEDAVKWTEAELKKIYGRQ